MALPVGVVWEIRTGGNDTNGGAFYPGGGSGTDYSQTDNKRTATGTNDSTTDAVANGTTTITSATANFTSALANNIIYLAGGSGGITGRWYRVVSVTNSTTIVIDRAIAASTGMTMNIGGGLASIGQLGANWQIADQFSSFPLAYIQSGTYNVDTASSNTSGKFFSLLFPGSGYRIEGYQTTHGDLGTPPVLNLTGTPGSNAAAFDTRNFVPTNGWITNITVDVNNLAANGFLGDMNLWKCTVLDASTTAAINCPNVATVLIECVVDGARGPSYSNLGNFYNCVAKNSTYTGNGAFETSGFHYNCLSINNACSGFYSINNTVYVNCTSYGNEDNGFYTIGFARYINCLAVNNGTDGSGVGFSWASNGIGSQYLNCAGYNNDDGNDNFPGTYNGPYVVGFIALSADPFTNAAGEDFSLNDTAGGGADLKGAGYGVFPIASVGFPDVGAVQSNAGGGGGGGGVSRSRVQRGM